jgi:hypothetical protein
MESSGHGNRIDASGAEKASELSRTHQFSLETQFIHIFVAGKFTDLPSK